MNVCIALIRGINVGGNNKIKMADLKIAFEQLGFEEVRTYIQSGNVLFRSDLPEGELRTKIESKLRDEFGVKKAVALIRTNAELQRILKDCPFTQTEIAEASQLYVDMLDAPLSGEQAARIAEFAAEGERCVVKERDIYLLLRHSILDSGFAKLFEKMKLPLTSRNWNTMNKLGELARGMEA